MKCRECDYCSQRSSYEHFFCDRDNKNISSDDYYKGKKMDCIINQIEDNEFMEDYIIYNIVRK
jgi:hypothetical protein